MPILSIKPSNHLEITELSGVRDAS